MDIKVKEAFQGMDLQDVKDVKDFMSEEELNELKETEKLEKVKSQAQGHLTTAATNLFKKKNLSRYREETFPILVRCGEGYRQPLRIIICTTMEILEAFENDMGRFMGMETGASVTFGFLRNSEESDPRTWAIDVRAESLHAILRMMQARPCKDILQVSRAVGGVLGIPGARPPFLAPRKRKGGRAPGSCHKYYQASVLTSKISTTQHHGYWFAKRRFFLFGQQLDCLGYIGNHNLTP